MKTIEILQQNGLSISLENGRLKVNPKENLTDKLRALIYANKQKILVELKARNLESLLSGNDEMSEQFDFEVSERTAIMTIDGKLPEAEAVRLAEKTTFQIWLDLFGE